MDKVAFCTLRSLIISSPKKKNLFACLSEEMQTEIQTSHKENIEVTDVESSIYEQLDTIHFSWFIPHLRSLTEKDAKLFISCLSLQQIQELKKALMLSQSFPKPTTLAKKYLTQELCKTIVPKNLIPPCFLPQHPLLTLLDLNTTQLNTLIELLAMHDLAVEMTQIISTQKLKLIDSALTKEQATYLKKLSTQKEPVIFKKIGLSEWNTDVEILKNALMQRGINRLAKAIYPIHTSFTWYISHHLEMEKGNLLTKLSTTTNAPQTADLLKNQILLLMKTLNY
ncbi:MAG: hypothetical protein LBC45_03405 [Chlamydiales bacterium]|jgi:hypothetical protein|nr:hypothetical protein [Chlamydiales bacterium]